MKNGIEALVEISRYYGKDPAYVIAGGGNTSFKNEDELFIKASGISLATIDAGGFVKMSRQKLAAMESKSYPEAAVEREEAVKQDLKAAILSPENLRPSVETSLHNLIDYAFVVHTHPTLVNGVMCSNQAESFIKERFGKEALYMEYTDPGYILFRKLQAKVRDHVAATGTSPKIIFLQNHGIFVAADTVEEIKKLYDSVMANISDGKDVSLPGETGEMATGPDALKVQETPGAIKGLIKPMGLLCKTIATPLTHHFLQNAESVQKISRPFTPDIIVYCKSNYLFLEKGTGEEETVKKVQEFNTEHGYLPKVVLTEGGSFTAIEENEKSVNTVIEVFLDMMKISYLSEQFGGPHFMTPEQIAFIDSWEVENYRRSIAKK